MHHFPFVSSNSNVIVIATGSNSLAGFSGINCRAGSNLTLSATNGGSISVSSLQRAAAIGPGLGEMCGYLTFLNRIYHLVAGEYGDVRSIHIANGRFEISACQRATGIGAGPSVVGTIVIYSGAFLINSAFGA
jgi:hypothetical protein